MGFVHALKILGCNGQHIKDIEYEKIREYIKRLIKNAAAKVGEVHLLILRSLTKQEPAKYGQVSFSF